MAFATQRGATLVIVLLLLLILTMLMLAGASTATAELVMAGNEQYRKRASDAASAGIEQAISRIAMSGGTNTSVAPTPFGSSGTDTYATTTQYAGRETALPQSSVDKLVGLHYTVTSTGSSLRGAVDVQTQGVLLVVPAAGINTYEGAGP